MDFRKAVLAGVMGAALIATLAPTPVVAAAASPAPAWRPESREDLAQLLTCGAILEEEIKRISARLAPTVWTRSHQIAWRLSADMNLIEAALHTAMDRETQAAARATLVSAEIEDEAEAERRALADVSACGALARRIHRAGDAEGRPLPRMPSSGVYFSYAP